MYKTRGKPEDPWNRVAAEQEKDLAETIRINHIRRNGLVQQLQTFTWSPTARQKELARRRNNYEQFRETYQDKFRRSNMRGHSMKDLGKISETNVNYDRHNTVKRFVSSKVNDIRSKEDTKTSHKPVVLRAPLGTVKTIKVEVPVRYNEAAIFCPPKSGEGESLPFLQKLKDIKKLQEMLSGGKKSSTEESVQTDLVKELQEANIEVDVGNAQLEQINKILQATRSLVPLKQEEEVVQEDDKTRDNNRSNLYNVETSHKTQAEVSKQSVKEAALSKKNKLLLTLNDVNHRIQKMQARFFSDSRPRYRSVNGVYRPSKPRPLELLYKNENYPRLQSVNKVTGKLSSNEEEITNSRKLSNHLGRADKLELQYSSIQPHTANDKQILCNQNVKTSPRLIELSHLNRLANYSAMKELLSPRRATDDSTSIDLIENNLSNRQTHEELAITLEVDNNEGNDNTTVECSPKLKLQESILKSNFLMKEFDVNSRDKQFNMNEMLTLLNNNHSNKKSVQFSLNDFQKSKVNEFDKIYERKRKWGPYNLPSHNILKNTLYYTDEK